MSNTPDAKDEAQILKEAEEKFKAIEKTYGTTKVKQENENRHPDDISDIDPIFGDLYMHEPFLGVVSAGITKVPDAKCPTAYVGARPNGKSHEIIMGFNPKFMRLWNSAKKKGVVKHELYHVVLQHIFSPPYF